ncbi:MAG: hypothetical protein ACMXYM_00220 [Candidatus Woesearchaeota archaeon]
MEIQGDVSEDEVVAVFLKGELGSQRFGAHIRQLLEQDGRGTGLVLHPNLQSEEENLYRRSLLGLTRGFGMNRDLFERFPDDVRWKNARIPKEELERVKYINYSYWNEISRGTRLPRDAAKRILNGDRAYGVGNDGFFEILSAIKEKRALPRMILVAKSRRSRVVVLEGHARLTAYFLAPDHIPRVMDVIIGFSDRMPEWGLY